MSSSRCFGVELEHGNPHGDRYEVYQYVADRMAEAGFKVSTGGLGLRNGHDYKTTYSVGADGSGVEVRTRILQGEAGFAELKELMDLLVDIGGFTARADGMHVHLGAEDYAKDRAAAARLLKTWRLQRDEIGKLIAPHRNGPNAYNPDSWSEQFIREFESGRRNTMGRADLNYDHLHKGHIEFRCHEGTLDYTMAAAWIKFCQHLMDSVITRKNPIGQPIVCPDLDALTKRVRLPKQWRETCLDIAGTKHLVAA